MRRWRGEEMTKKYRESMYVPRSEISVQEGRVDGREKEAEIIERGQRGRKQGCESRTAVGNPRACLSLMGTRESVHTQYSTSALSCNELTTASHLKVVRPTD
eukprot:GHVU01000416.1.p7 GENE.GHVU01000416.1~~GHVU01000416.1.p7  ORF type:complete len:102 (+),score=9.39 GHVU01000416.1:1097-1402(+)